MCRGPWPAVLVCGACGNWLAVGYRPDDVGIPAVLLACPACRRLNDPCGAMPLGECGASGAAGPPEELSRSEVWAKAAVEQVHTLAARERRWPWRAGGDAEAQPLT